MADDPTDNLPLPSAAAITAAAADGGAMLSPGVRTLLSQQIGSRPLGKIADFPDMRRHLASGTSATSIASQVVADMANQSALRVLSQSNLPRMKEWAPQWQSAAIERNRAALHAALESAKLENRARATETLRALTESYRNRVVPSISYSGVAPTTQTLSPLMRALTERHATTVPSTPAPLIAVAPRGAVPRVSAELHGLHFRLQAFSARLAEKRDGAWEQVSSNAPDALTQGVHSAVEMMAQLLKALAPDEVVMRWAEGLPEPCNDERRVVRQRRATYYGRALYIIRGRGLSASAEKSMAAGVEDHLTALQEIKHDRLAASPQSVKAVLISFDAFLHVALGA